MYRVRDKSIRIGLGFLPQVRSCIERFFTDGDKIWRVLWFGDGLSVSTEGSCAGSLVPCEVVFEVVEPFRGGGLC